jgi:hypothetical protein
MIMKFQESGTEKNKEYDFRFLQLHYIYITPLPTCNLPVG